MRPGAMSEQAELVLLEDLWKGFSRRFSYEGFKGIQVFPLEPFEFKKRFPAVLA